MNQETIVIFHYVIKLYYDTILKLNNFRRLIKTF